MPRRTRRTICATCASWRSSFAIMARCASTISLDGARLLLGREIDPGGGGMLRPDLAVLAAELEVDRGQQCPDRRSARTISVGVGSSRSGGMSSASSSHDWPRYVRRISPPTSGKSATCLPGPVDDEMQRAIEEVIEGERHGALIVGDQGDRAVRAADPGGDLPRIGDGRGEADELDMLRAEDDRLFPRRAALRVGEEVDLIEDDRVDRVHLPRRLDEHIAHDFRRHHEDRRARIDGHVAGQQPDRVAVAVAQIAEFLIGERLDRRRVHDPPVTQIRLMHSVFRDDRFSCAGRGGDHHRFAAPQRFDGIVLKRVEGKREERMERRKRLPARVRMRHRY